jgi:cytidyltransferase-like protein
MNVYVDGVFDLFHEGHINFLRNASTYGKLIVGVHDDEFVASYKRKPFIPEKSRYAVVKACRYVDVIIEGVGVLTEEILDEYQIGLVLHGDDFSYDRAYEFFSVAIDRGIFKLINYTRGISSTIIIEQIAERFQI